LYPTTECEIDLRKATISIVLSDQYFHALNAVHGSVYFKLLDDSAFFAVNSIVEDAFVLTTSFTSNLVRPVSSGKIEAIGQVRFESKNLFMAESTLYDEKGNEIAFGSGSFVKSKINLSEEIGYK
jgi:uncharacterized protein (TIGR00369 family)